MRDLVAEYKSGLIKGMISADECTNIWNLIKSESPSLISVLNSLKDGINHSSNEELHAFSEKLKIYSFLIGSLCRFNLRKEVPYYDQNLEQFINSVQKRVDPTLYRLDTAPLKDEYLLLKNESVVFTSQGISLFHILCHVLKQKNTSIEVFMFYLSLRNQPGAEESVKKHWVLNLFETQKLV